MITNVASILQDEEFITMITNNAPKEEIMKKIAAY